MPKETRYIVFSLGETEAVLRRGLVQLNRTCPPGRLRCMAARRSGFVFVYDGGRTVQLPPAELFAAVLWHCQAHRIPIAHQFEKRFEILGRQLVLVSGALAHARPAAQAIGGPAETDACALCVAEGGRCPVAEVAPAGGVDAVADTPS
jgi:hypothetical protein